MENKFPKLGGGGRFQPADFTVPRYAALVPGETTLANVLHPDYFQNHLDRLKAGMEVTVISDDYTLDVRLRCLAVTKVTASFRVLDVYAGDIPEEGEQGEIDPEDISVGFAPAHKWRLIHRGEVIEKGFGTREEAEAAKKILLSANG